VEQVVSGGRDCLIVVVEEVVEIFYWFIYIQLSSFLWARQATSRWTDEPIVLLPYIVIYLIFSINFLLIYC
jgi:hypothetical protein